MYPAVEITPIRAGTLVALRRDESSGVRPTPAHSYYLRSTFELHGQSRSALPSHCSIGGGTGLPGRPRRPLRARRRPRQALGTANDTVTAIVTVTDDGGSSGRLRREFGVLPPGDIRNCLAALARWTRLSSSSCSTDSTTLTASRATQWAIFLLTALTPDYRRFR